MRKLLVIVMKLGLWYWSWFSVSSITCLTKFVAVENKIDNLYEYGSGFPCYSCPALFAALLVLFSDGQQNGVCRSIYPPERKARTVVGQYEDFAKRRVVEADESSDILRSTRLTSNCESGHGAPAGYGSQSASTVLARDAQWRRTYTWASRGLHCAVPAC